MPDPGSYPICACCETPRIAHDPGCPGYVPGGTGWCDAKFWETHDPAELARLRCEHGHIYLAAAQGSLF